MMPSSFSGAPSISRLTAEYSHTQSIGEGSFGAVLVATHDLDGQSYAVKKSQKPILGETDLQHRLQEAYAESVCSNPYLLRYYDSWVEDRALYIRSELVPGGTVHGRPRPWAESELMELLKQMCMALHWLHSANMAHLDVKPENILFTTLTDTGEFIFKLGDFGLARRVEESSSGGGGLLSEEGVIQERFTGENDEEGDCRYLCPAMLKSPDATTWREADVYSLGASLVELMGGNPSRVRHGEYPASLRASLGYLQPDEAVPDVVYSSSLSSMVMAMTAPNPMQRPSAFAVLERLLDTSCLPQQNDAKKAEEQQEEEQQQQEHMDANDDAERRANHPPPTIAEALSSRRATLQLLREELALLESEVALIESSER